MTRQMMGIYAAVAAVLGAVVFVVVHQNQSELLTLQGKFTQVRTASLTENATLVILDFAAKNPSKLPFLINGIEALRGETGGQVEIGGLLSRSEITSYFEYHKMELSNVPLRVGETIAAGTTRDALVAARFEVPLTQMKGATVRIRIRDLNGVRAEISGKVP